MSTVLVPTADEVEQAVALRDPELVEAAREVDLDVRAVLRPVP